MVAVDARITSSTSARVRVDSIGAGGTVLAWTTGAVVDNLVARGTSVTSLTLARVRVDTVVTSGTILAWAALTVVDY